MDHLVWRPRAKFVAVAGFVIVLLSAGTVAAAVYLLGTDEGLVVYKEHIKTIYLIPAVDSKVPRWQLLAILPVAAAFMFIQTLADFKLLLATRSGSNPMDSLRHAKFWMIVSSTLLVISAFGYISTFAILPFVISVTCRGASIHVVMYFIQEVKQMMSTKYHDDRLGDKLK